MPDRDPEKAALIHGIGGIGLAALPTIRRNASAHDKANAFQLKGGYTIPLIAFSLSLWTGSHASLNAWLVTGALLAFGLVLYLVAHKQRRVPTAFPPPTP